MVLKILYVLSATKANGFASAGISFFVEYIYSRESSISQRERQLFGNIFDKNCIKVKEFGLRGRKDEICKN